MCFSVCFSVIVVWWRAKCCSDLLSFAACCSVLQCALVSYGVYCSLCCSVLQCVAVCWGVLRCVLQFVLRVLQCVAVCCSVLRCVEVCIAVCVAVCCSVLHCWFQCVVVCCRVCCRVCCSVLQWLAVCCREFCLRGRGKESACESLCAWVLCVSVCVDSCQKGGGGAETQQGSFVQRAPYDLFYLYLIFNVNYIYMYINRSLLCKEPNMIWSLSISFSV